MDSPNGPALTFLGLTFEPIRLADKAVLQDYLRRFPQKVSGYTFASLAAWAVPYAVHWTRVMIDAAGYRLINREEDLDKEGLRQAKLSYYPLEIYPVCNLTLNADEP